MEITGGDAMTDLRRYNAGDVLNAANELREEFETGTLNLLELGVRMNEFRFRDEKGSYWFLDARTGQWFRFDQGQWHAPTAGPRDLEGSASLPITSPDSIEETLKDEPIPESEAPEGIEPTQVLASVVQTVRSAYEAGQISSTDAETLLGRQYVIDNTGRPWMVGVRSDQWHYFGDEGWVKSNEPPGLDSLARLEVPQVCGECGHAIEGNAVCPQCGTDVLPVLSDVSDEAYPTILNFMLLALGSLPEPVTDPWDPPSGFPAALEEHGIRCASCSAVNPPGSRFCNRCAASLGCPTCGSQVTPGSKFCTKCGTRLG
jgi:hypothetical protein